MLKFCFCAKNSVKQNYESLPYEQEQEPIEKSLEKQIEMNKIKLTNLAKMKKQISQQNSFDRPILQSTRIDQTGLSFTSNKLANSLFTTKNAYPEDLPNITDSKSSQLDASSTIFSSDSMYSDSSCSPKESDTDSSQLSGELNIYVCNKHVIAKFRGDICLRQAEKVQVLHSNNDFTFVRTIATKECGYVPTGCLTQYSQFIKTVNLI